MKFPILTTFLVSAVVLTASFFVSYEASAWVAIRYAHANTYKALGVGEAKYYRGASQSLMNCSSLRALIHASEPTLPQQLQKLTMARATAPLDVQPVFDMQIATGEAVMAGLSEKAGRSAEAAAHREKARSLLRGLGWKDVSDEVLNRLVTDEQEILSELPL